MNSSPRRILVAGALANKPGNAGEAWVRMSWVLGLMRMGFDVLFVEELSEEACVDEQGLPVAPRDSLAARWFLRVTRDFGIPGRSALLPVGAGRSIGVPREHVESFAASASLLVNISGHLRDPGLLEAVSRRAYIDLDPGFTHFWHAQGIGDLGLDAHDLFFTVGERVGQAGCVIPTGDLDWQPVRQPIVMNRAAPPDVGARAFTTIGSWRGPFGPVEHEGVTYGLKVHEFRKVLNLPALTRATFRPALSIHEADASDREALAQAGWEVLDPARELSDAAVYERFIDDSGAEFSVAQGMYVTSGSGWFSDRSARYLASGKPVVVQDTSLSAGLRTDAGLLTFNTVDEAAAAIERVLSDYARQRSAALEIAYTCFRSEVVLSDFLERCHIDPGDAHGVASAAFPGLSHVP